MKPNPSDSNVFLKTPKINSIPTCKKKDEYISLINSLEGNCKRFYGLITNFLKEIKSNTFILNTQILYSINILDELKERGKNVQILLEKIDKIKNNISILDNAKELLNKNIIKIEKTFINFFDNSQKIMNQMRKIHKNSILQGCKKVQHLRNNSYGGNYQDSKNNINSTPQIYNNNTLNIINSEINNTYNQPFINNPESHGRTISNGFIYPSSLNNSSLYKVKSFDINNMNINPDTVINNFNLPLNHYLSVVDQNNNKKQRNFNNFKHNKLNLNLNSIDNVKNNIDCNFSSIESKKTINRNFSEPKINTINKNRIVSSNNLYNKLNNYNSNDNEKIEICYKIVELIYLMNEVNISDNKNGNTIFNEKQKQIENVKLALINMVKPIISGTKNSNHNKIITHTKNNKSINLYSSDLEINTIDNKNNKQDDLVDNLKSSIKDLKSKINFQNKEIVKNKEDIKQLSLFKKKCLNIIIQKDRINSMNFQEINKLKEKINELSSQNNELSVFIEHYKNNNLLESSTKKSDGILSQKENETDSMEFKINNATEIDNQFKKNMNKIKYNKIQKNIFVVDKKNDFILFKSFNYKDIIDNKNKEILKLSELNKELKEKNIKNKNQINEFIKKNLEMGERNNNYENEINNLKTNLKEKENINMNLETNLKQKEKKFKELQNKYNSEKENLTSQLNNLQLNQIKNIDLDELNKNIFELKSERDELNKQIKINQKNINNLENENSILQSQIKRYECLNNEKNIQLEKTKANSQKILMSAPNFNYKLTSGDEKTDQEKQTLEHKIICLQLELNKQIAKNVKLKSGNSENVENLETLGKYENKIKTMEEKYSQDLKDKEDEIEYLNNEINELKKQIEENEVGKNSISKENNMEIDEIINDYETKIKFLTERNNYIEKGKKYNSDSYKILCDKSFRDFQWFLLLPKSFKIEEANYNNFIWADKSYIADFSNFEYISEENEVNKNNNDKRCKKVFTFEANENKDFSFSNMKNNYGV